MDENVVEKWISLVQLERLAQVAKWGEQNLSQSIFMLILMEEIGELAKAFLECNPKNAFEELIQVGAVIQQMYEAGERNDWFKS